MTDKKITVMTAQTGAGVAIGDLFEMVDISDVTDDPTGTNKKITANELAIAIKALATLVATADLSAYLALSLITTKGDLILGTAASTVARKGIGADTTVLVADSTQPTGVKWGTGTDIGALAQAIDTQVGTTYTLVLADAGKLITLNNGSSITLTIPTNASVAFATGTIIDLAQLGAGQVTVAAAGGVTLNKRVGAKLAGQYAKGQLVKYAADTWLLSGDLSA